MYRPPPSKKNQQKDNIFISELPDLFELSNLQGGDTFYLGDFNVHFDCPLKPTKAKIIDCLFEFDLVQAVDVPTHRKGHILDWFIYKRGFDKLISIRFRRIAFRPLMYRV